ncbi:MAG: phage tail sheath subtilisin-like domain-containing protein [Oscillospiraceae bacterium]|nr:phage tail sheath subtilisin-like domain-containing protein [Oscillospiraceae bacterium]
MARLTGAVINVYSDATLSVEPGARGTAAMACELDWYEDGVMSVYNSDDDAMEVFAHELGDLLYVKEMMKRASKALIWPLNSGGEKASAEIADGITATAVKCGERGNDISVVCEKYGELWRVSTFVDGEEMDIQVLSDISQFEENGFVSIEGNGTMAEATVSLENGSNGSISENSYDKFLEALEMCEYNTIAYTGDDAAVKNELSLFVDSQREQGKYVQVCMGDYPADSEGVISFANGVVLADGTVLDADQVSAWLAGATAAAEVNESLTYDSYDGAVAVKGELKPSGQLQKKNQGIGCFIMNNGKVKVESDINTLVSFTSKRGKEFSKNRVLRVIDGVCADVKKVFDSSFAGVENNNTDGRNRFKATVCEYMTALMEKNAIENFVSDDVTVVMGAAKDEVKVNLRIQPVDSMEKADITVRVR